MRRLSRLGGSNEEDSIRHRADWTVYVTIRRDASHDRKGTSGLVEVDNDRECSWQL